MMLSTQKQQRALAAEHAGPLREITPEERARLQKTLLSMGLDIARVCRKHGLSFMLCGGSALGAVRHEGFIPWDDDLDIAMPRADFEALKAAFPRELADEYEMQVPNADGAPITHTFMKVVRKGTVRREMLTQNTPGSQGVYVDVFPLDFAPDRAGARAVKGALANLFAFLAVSNTLYRFRDRASRRFFGQTLAGRFVYRMRMFAGFLLCAFSHRSIYNAYDRFIQGKPSDTLTIAAGRGHYIREALPKAAFLPPRECAFEGETMFVPADADRYLSNLYGDYMRVPPPEKRERHCVVELDFGETLGEE